MNLAADITSFEKKPNITLVPMIPADIYRALTICKDGKNYFEGCNMLLQLWMIDDTLKLTSQIRSKAFVSSK